MASDSLRRARTIAARCGVTRLADVTGLDRIGMPVFQAVRPCSKALSVHQGKGLTRDQAMLGALMEAVESHHAEIFAGERVVAAFDDLPCETRAPSVSDFASDGSGMPGVSAQLEWVRATRLITNTTLMTPFEFVSLDCTSDNQPWIDKSSVGLAAHFDRGKAILAGLYEVIERDAEWAWRRRSIHERTLYQIDTGSTPFAWFQQLGDNIRRAGLHLTVYCIPAVIPLPVFICEILEPGAGQAARQLVYGSGAHSAAETALLRSLVEAVQSRVTLIAGVRDDISYPDTRTAAGESIGMGLPMPPGLPIRTWDEATAGLQYSADVTPYDLAVLLARAGYPDAAVVDLSQPDFDAQVIKALCPGLGSIDRLRRQTGAHQSSPRLSSDRVLALAPALEAVAAF